MNNHYQILEIEPDASDNLIKMKYRKLSMRNHPDRPGEGNREMFIKVQKAYEVLIDRREQYNALPEIAEWINAWRAKKDEEKEKIKEEKQKEIDLQKAKDLEIEGLKKKVAELTEENENLKIQEEFVIV